MSTPGAVSPSCGARRTRTSTCPPDGVYLSALSSRINRRRCSDRPLPRTMKGVTGGLEAQVHRPAFGQRLHFAPGGRRDRADIDRLPAGRIEAGIASREEQEIFHQSGHVARIVLDFVEGLAVLVGRSRLAERQFRGRPDQRDRCSKLVRRVRRETDDVVHGRLQPGEHVVERRRQPPKLVVGRRQLEAPVEPFDRDRLDGVGHLRDGRQRAAADPVAAHAREHQDRGPQPDQQTMKLFERRLRGTHRRRHRDAVLTARRLDARHGHAEGEASQQAGRGDAVGRAASRRFGVRHVRPAGNRRLAQHHPVAIDHFEQGFALRQLRVFPELVAQPLDGEARSRIFEKALHAFDAGVQAEIGRAVHALARQPPARAGQRQRGDRQDGHVPRGQANANRLTDHTASRTL